MKNIFTNILILIALLISTDYIVKARFLFLKRAAINYVLILVLLSVINPFNVLSQSIPTGPGGVGSQDGTTTLVAWYSPENMRNSFNALPVDGQAVAKWLDKSGHGNTATNSGTAIYQSNAGAAQNGNAIMTGTNLDRQFFTSGNVTGQSIFAVNNPGTTPSNFSGLTGFNGDIGIRRPGNTQSPYDNYFQYPGHPGTNINTMSNTSGQSFINETSGGLMNDTWNIVFQNRPTTYTNVFYIGGYFAGRSFTGSVPEIVVYSASVNNAQRMIVDNYLAAKYGQALAVASDVYTMDDPANGNYDFNVAGIGRVDASNIHNDAQGTGMVRVNNPSALIDGSFFTWGDDNSLLGLNNFSDVPPTVQSRMLRTWRINNTGVGTVDISFDLTGLGHVTASDLRLLIDKNNSGTFSDETSAGGGVVSGATLISGSIYKFSGITIGNGLRFSLGTTNSSQTPLPVKFIDFTATTDNTNQQVILNWSTTSEVNNNYFTVERSSDGIQFVPVKELPSKGNSSKVQSYSVADEKPLVGNSYYRIKQTDYNNNFTYSTILAINLSVSDISFGIFPNPSNGESITLEIKTVEKEVLVVVYDMIGNELFSKNATMENTGNTYLDPSNKLLPGNYIITVSSDKQICRQKLIIY
jgi:hypothetical protein